MDIAELENNCAVLTIDEEEDRGLDAPLQDEASGSVTYYELVGRFLTDRPIKVEHMQQVMASIWQPLMGVRIVPLEENLFAFQFPHIRDLHKVVDDGPWSFENKTLVCKQVPHFHHVLALRTLSWIPLITGFISMISRRFSPTLSSWKRLEIMWDRLKLLTLITLVVRGRVSTVLESL